VTLLSKPGINLYWALRVKKKEKLEPLIGPLSVASRVNIMFLSDIFCDLFVHVYVIFMVACLLTSFSKAKNSMIYIFISLSFFYHERRYVGAC